MTRIARMASKSIEELWAIHEELAEILEAKMIEEKKELERRLVALHPATDHAKTRRPYPPVVPKFANPDQPSQVWSGRGKRPHWVTEKLASGKDLQDLSIARSRRHMPMSA